MGTEDLQQIEDLSRLFFTVAEIAVIMGVDINPNDTEVLEAINRGALKSEAELRKSIIDMAKAGSAPAQTLAVKMMDEYQLKKIV